MHVARPIPSPGACTATLRRAALLLFLLSGPAADRAACAQQTLRPVDQAASQPDFFTFRARLQSAIARRDTQAVLAVVHKDIKNSFGGEDGIDEFRQMWALSQPDSKLWEALGTALALGGIFQGDGSFAAPYVFGLWPEGADPFGQVAILGSAVRVRAEPNAAAEPVSRLTFAIVDVAEAASPNETWVAVRLAGGKVGYVDRRFVRSPVDYRAIFAQSDGRWQLTMFLAGD